MQRYLSLVLKFQSTSNDTVTWSVQTSDWMSKVLSSQTFDLVENRTKSKNFTAKALHSDSGAMTAVVTPTRKHTHNKDADTDLTM